MEKKGNVSGNLHLIAAIDEVGIVHHKLMKEYVKAETLIEFLGELSEKVEDEQVALFHDGLSVHLAP